VWALIYFLIFRWQIALALLILSLPSLKFLYDYGRFFRIYSSDVRWKFMKKHAPKL
jgi:hypothetical protein